MSVCNLLACPAARGTFHRAIAQSGAADHVGTRAEADNGRAIVREELAVDPDDADVDAVLRAQHATIEPPARASPRELPAAARRR